MAADCSNSVRTLAIRDDCGSTGIFDRMQQLFAPINTICRYCHRSNSPDGKVADQVLRGAVKVDADPVPPFNPKSGKPESYPVHLTPEFSITVCLVPCGAHQSCLGSRNTFCIQEGCDIRHEYQ